MLEELLSCERAGGIGATMAAGGFVEVRAPAVVSITVAFWSKGFYNV